MRPLYLWISSLLLKLFFSCSAILLLTGTAHAQIPTSNLVANYTFTGNANDESANHNNGIVHGATLTPNRFGETDKAYLFNGTTQYIEIPDANQLSIATTGELSISVWMRPDVLDFPSIENEYVHWMGKGTSSQQEWTFRIYDFNSSRPNRTSCYVFNLTGGLGSGSYVQETLIAGEWIHFVAVYNYPDNTVKIYKNGILRDTDFFTDYTVVPGNGTAPMRVGTRDFSSYFEGAIDDIRIYSRELTAPEVNELFSENINATGTTSSTENNSFHNYPNPAHQNLYISNTDHSLIKSIEIYNSAGQNLYSKEINATILQPQSIDVSAFDHGVYYIKYYTDKGVVINKFIKE